MVWCMSTCSIAVDESQLLDFSSLDQRGDKPQWLLRIHRRRKVIGQGRRGIESCSRRCVWVADVWSTCGEFLEVLLADWREYLLISAIILTVMAVVDGAAFE